MAEGKLPKDIQTSTSDDVHPTSPMTLEDTGRPCGTPCPGMVSSPSALADSTGAPLPRHRHDKTGENAVAPKSHIDGVSPGKHQKDRTLAAVPITGGVLFGSPARLALLSLGITGASLLCILLGLLLVQIVAQEGFDWSSSWARMEAAGRGREWFPVWVRHFVVETLTARRAEEEVGSGISAASYPPRGPAWAPPPPPQLSLASMKKLANSDAATVGSSSRAEAPSDPHHLHCYTLHSYSAVFLQAHRKPSEPHLFSCGTRVVDLRTEMRSEVLAACSEPDTPQIEDESPPAGETERLSPLRVVLTRQEVQWHHRLQPLNVVTQRIPLSRFNDDYCDCLDGTDELLTNACSMSGRLAPAASSRWRSYLISLQPLRLWESDDVIDQEDAEARGLPLQPRKVGDVGHRLYISTGPVLPFRCPSSGLVPQLLAPSLLGDGIVDCCDAEDEAAPQSTPNVPSHLAASVPTNEGATVVAEHLRVVRGVQEALLLQWRRRRSSISSALASSTVRYNDPLFPYQVTARALLVDKGYYSLFTAAEVQQERLAAAVMLRNIYRRGHRMQRLRVEKGWSELGQQLVDNRTSLLRQLTNVTHTMKSLGEWIRQQMIDAHVDNPQLAGVTMSQLNEYAQLHFYREKLEEEAQHITLATIHRAYGDHYEYYPIFGNILPLPSTEVIDTRTPHHLSPVVERNRARRRISVAQTESLMREAQGREHPIAFPLHVDNISVSHYGVQVMRQTYAAQAFDSSEAAMVAQRLGLLPNDDLAAYKPSVFQSNGNPFRQSPALPLGTWEPYRTHRDGRVMIVTDPAGDQHLARRACVQPTSTLFRGGAGGRLQWPTRHPDPPLLVNIPDADEEEKSMKEKLKDAAAGKTVKGNKVFIPYHTNRPSVLAVEEYSSTIRCEHDPPPSSRSRSGPTEGDDTREKASQLVRIYVTYVCAIRDAVLRWAANGRCAHEVVVGTPSACTIWALKVAEEHVRELQGLTA